MKISLCVLLLGVFAASIESSSVFNKCRPGVNCKLPDCRCWDDPQKPGDVDDERTPQMILLMFSYALNAHTSLPYKALFKNLSNPNGCPAVGTFFAQNNDTSTATLKELKNSGHELAVSTADGKHPKTVAAWRESLSLSSQKLMDAGVSRGDINGVIAPDMDEGGNDEMGALQDFNMKYEASCIMGPIYGTKGKIRSVMWPFTYDYAAGNAPKCNTGKTPTESYPGIWQFVIPEMTFQNHTCTSLSSCSPYLRSKGDVFTFIFETFQRHYYGNRSPFVIFVDPLWVSKSYQMEGLLQFLQVVSHFQHTWFLSASQALEWIKTPVPMYPGVRFMPWECEKSVKAANMANWRH